MSRVPLRVGVTIYGFAGGHFGRDSYNDRVVEDIGHDWVVTRNTLGVPEFFHGVPEDLIEYTIDNSDWGL